MRKFIKAHCAANDYVYVFGEPWKMSEIISACKQKIGIGADGVIFINKRDGVFCLDIFNSDGSPADFCGNACLTAAKILVERGATRRFCFRLKTRAKIIEARVIGKKAQIICSRATAAVLSSQARGVIEKLKEDKRIIGAKAFNAGNLHLSIAAKSLSRGFTDGVVKKVNKSGAFADGINIEFFTLSGQKTSGKAVSAVVYERGSGYTMSCGSGALAVFECYNALISNASSLTVKYAGGDLTAALCENGVCLVGEPKIIYDGELFDNFCGDDE